MEGNERLYRLGVKLGSGVSWVRPCVHLGRVPAGYHVCGLEGFERKGRRCNSFYCPRFSPRPPQKPCQLL